MPVNKNESIIISMIIRNEKNVKNYRFDIDLQYEFKSVKGVQCFYN